jgi:hypothetical protein
MSVASSAASAISVSFDGRVTNLEDALDGTMKDMQKLLNELHLGIREMIDDGVSTDPEEFKERVHYTDYVCDLITRMIRLLEEIPPMAVGIQGTPPAPCKVWYTAHKSSRKTQLSVEKADHKAAAERANTELKAKIAENKDADLVVFNGEVVPPEQALDKGMIGIQRFLNNLHMEMRKLACLTEQQIDEEEDFRESVEFAEHSSDLVTKLVWLLDEVFLLVVRFQGKAPTECKAWYVEHKAQRKVTLAAEKAEHKAAAEKAKAELKAMLALEAKEP